jgi:hypothetical protein
MARIIVIWFLAVLSVVIWWMNRVDSTASIVTDRPMMEAGIPQDQVDEITLEYRGGRTLGFERDGVSWRQIEPFSVGVDAFSARQIAVVASSLRASDFVEIGNDESGREQAARLGFDDPAVRVTWKWGNETRVLILGNRTLAGRGWARLEDEKVAWLVDSTLHERLLDMDSRLWRDRSLLPTAGVETREIEIMVGDASVSLESGLDGWTLTRPVAARGDAAAISEWLSDVSRTSTQGYLFDRPESLEPFGLEPPLAVVRLTERDGTSHTVLIGDPIGVGSPERYGMVQGSPTILRLDEQAQQALVPSAVLFVDPTGSAVVRADVGSLEVRPTDASDFTLTRDFDRWILEFNDDERGSVEVPRQAVESLLGQLTSARASEIEFLDYPTELEYAVVILFGLDGLPLDTVRVIRDPNDGRWALENGDGVLRIFPASLQPALRPQDFGVIVP